MKLFNKGLTFAALICMSLFIVPFSANAAAAEYVENELYSGSSVVESPWTVGTEINTTNAGGKFNPSEITKDGYFRIDYTGEEGSVYLAFSNWTTGQWTRVNPSKSEKTETGYYSEFTFEDCVSAYGIDDFSEVSAVCAGSGESAATITKLSWYSNTNKLVETELFSGAAAVDSPWTVATTTNTTNTNGNFDSSLVTKDGYFRVEYTGEEGNVYLAFCNWATGQWASVNPIKSGKTKNGYYSEFAYADCVAAYGTEDFSDVSTICTSSTSSPLTVTKVSWYGYPLKDTLGADAILYKGSVSASAQNTFLTYFFTKHVGGDWDASKINKDSYFYVEYTGAKDGIYLALTSTSGATNWVAVYPDKTELTASGSYYSIYSYDNFSKAFGTNFVRLDQIQVYSAKDENVTLKKIAYFSGTGDPVDTSSTEWDRPDTGIAFLGDSIVQNAMYLYGDWNTILGRTDCSNYGIGSQTTVECERRIKDITSRNYSKIVMLCGINDIGHGMTTDETISNYKSMFAQVNKANPDTEIYLISVLPTTDVFYKGWQYKMIDLDKAYKELADEYDYVTYVDCYPSFVAEDGYCNPDLVRDGLHPNDKGYAIIAGILNPYLNDEITSNLVETNLYSGSTVVDSPLTLATTTNTTNAGGEFDPAKISKDGYFRIDYTGEEGSVYLAFSNWTTGQWVTIDPSKSGKSKNGYFSEFSFDDCASAYGSEDFSDVSAISTGSGDSPATITKLSWYTPKETEGNK